MRVILKSCRFILFRSMQLLLPVIALLALSLAPALIAPNKYFFFDNTAHALLLNGFFPLFFAFLSYEFSEQLLEKDKYEMLWALPGVRRKTVGCISLLLLSILICCCLIQFLTYLVLASRFGALGAVAVRHLLFAVVLYGFLPGLLGITLGMALSEEPRMRAYAYILVLGLLFSPLMAEILPESWMGRILKMDEWVTIFVHPHRYLMDPLYGIPLEAARWALILFWIGLFFFFWLIKKENHATLAGKTMLLLTVCVILLCGYRFSVRGRDSLINLPSGNYERSYPDIAFYRQWIGEPQEADFAVESVHMSLRCDDRLSADVTVILQTQYRGKNRYGFTLHHALEVLSVTDSGGRPVPFSREGDWVDVLPKYETESFRFTYEGAIPRYYTNRQGVLLPAYIAYYPRPGHLELWDRNQSGGGCTNPVMSEQKVTFEVQMDAPVPLVSNLDETSSGTFEGCATSVSLYGGLLYEEEYDGIRYERFYLKKQEPLWQKDEIEAEWEKLKDKFDLQSDDSHPSIRKAFPLPDSLRRYHEKMLLMDECLYYDGTVFELPDVANVLFTNLSASLHTEGQNSLLFTLLKQYIVTETPGTPMLPAPEELEPLIRADQEGVKGDAKEYIHALDAFEGLFWYSLENVGEESFLPAVYRFLAEGDDEKHPVTFLYELNGIQ